MSILGRGLGKFPPHFEKSPPYADPGIFARGGPGPTARKQL